MAFTPQELQTGFLIGECRIEPRENRILRGDMEAHVEPRVMDVLVCLAEHAGEVVSRDMLNQRVWGNIVVTDQAVTNCISELRQHLGDDRSAHRVIETIPKRGYRLVAPVVPGLGSSEHLTRRRTWLVAAGLVLMGVIVLGAAWRWKWMSAPSVTSVAVLRFENAAGDASLDYLTLALPDEIATLLTKSPDLTVRPSGYVDGDKPLAVARARRVDHIVSGRYYVEDNAQLSLAVEAQDVAQERVVWRTRITAPAGDLLVMRERIAVGIREGLLPALGARAVPTSGSPPAHVEAYQLYLRSLALPKQPQPTERAIDMLERAVTLDPEFAPAWEALGTRLYDHATYGTGATPARQQALAAHRKALELDPELLGSARYVVIHHAGSGDLETAYREARRLLDHFGSSAQTQFALAIVYRMGGLLELSQRHCELALEHDPQEPRLRSCAYAYLYAGKLSRVMHFLMLDEGSYFVQWGTVLYHLRTGDLAAALRGARQAADDPTRRLMEPCLEGTRGAALDGAVAEFVEHWQRNTDFESPYAVAPMLLVCGRPDEALRFVERSVDGNFCSFPALDLDPVWAPLRDNAEFRRIRAKARACHDEFRRMVEAHDAASDQ